MHIDWKAFRRAREVRDVRFDGKFFVGARSTKIYCRPSCPVPTIPDKNVCYFPSAAAAAEAGFRPCLRCRPETSPGTPAWLGTPNTVTRALRIIAQSGLEDGGVEGLAEKLGVGSRHLRRLFVQHLGASPSAVAQTRRLHFAKKLIDETALPMNQIAIASGFGCVRRFNDTIYKTYRRTPTQIRRRARHNETQEENQYTFRLRFRPPYDWKGMLRFLEARATPGVELVKDDKYLRSISLAGSNGWFEISFDERGAALVAHVHFSNPNLLFRITERIRQMFDLNADWLAIVDVLKSDPLLAKLTERNPGLRIPGCWNGFELTVRAILGQQINVKGATTLAGRLVKAFGEPFSATGGITYLFPTAQVLSEAKPARIGLTEARAATIRSLARAVCRGEICFERITDLQTLIEQLLELPGIGRWTAQYIAMRALGDPDAFPSADIALLRRSGAKDARELESRAENWRPWRAYAAIYLWSAAGEHQAPQSRSLGKSKTEVSRLRAAGSVGGVGGGNPSRPELRRFAFEPGQRA